MEILARGVKKYFRGEGDLGGALICVLEPFGRTYGVVHVNPVCNRILNNLNIGIIDLCKFSLLTTTLYRSRWFKKRKLYLS